MPYADPRSEAAIASRRARARRTYYKNREKQVARAAEYNRTHKDRVNSNSVERRLRSDPARVLWWNARNRAKAKGIEFSLVVEDITVPEVCPVLGIPLIVGRGHARDTSPSLDRIDPTKGYTPSNVAVISHKANTMKSNAAVEEIRALLRYLEKLA